MPAALTEANNPITLPGPAFTNSVGCTLAAVVTATGFEVAVDVGVEGVVIVVVGVEDVVAVGVEGVVGVVDTGLVGQGLVVGTVVTVLEGQGLFVDP